MLNVDLWVHVFVLLCVVGTCGSYECSSVNVEHDLIWVVVFALVHMNCSFMFSLFMCKSCSCSDVFSAGLIMVRSLFY